MKSKRDIWGEAAMAQPNGSSPAQSLTLAIPTRPFEAGTQFKKNAKIYGAQRAACAKTWREILARVPDGWKVVSANIISAQAVPHAPFQIDDNGTVNISSLKRNQSIRFAVSKNP